MVWTDMEVVCYGKIPTNRDGDTMIRVGLASTSPHVPTGELEAAHLQNEHGAGYRFGYYDSNLNFVELALPRLCSGGVGPYPDLVLPINPCNKAVPISGGHGRCLGVGAITSGAGSGPWRP